MKIKTITCHDVYNYGATLQAYALMTYLEMKGHEVEIIDYKPPYLSTRFNFFVTSERFEKRNFLIKSLCLIKHLPRRLFLYIGSCKKSFDSFNQKYLKLTSVRYHCFDELKKEPPIADVYIVGSDQVWNTAYKNGRDPAFYLAFAPSKAKRISYAASFSTQEILPEYKNFVKDKIELIDFVSVREQTGLNILNSLGIKRGVHVMDPVFLHDQNFWSKLARRKVSDKYILVYDFEKNTQIEKFAKKMAKKLGIKIYAVNNYFRTPYADVDCYDAGPRKFLSLIKNAEVVIGNSFHALSFSLIFEKEFFVFHRGHAINSRMEDLLDLCGLRERLIFDGNHSSKYNPIDYEVVHSKLTPKIETSKKFLSESIPCESIN